MLNKFNKISFQKMPYNGQTDELISSKYILFNIAGWLS